MASANVSEFTDNNFETEVIASKLPVLVDFWAEWCQPCRLLNPIVESIADELSGKAKVGKVDIEANKVVAETLGITSIPTLLIFKGGKPVKRFVGLSPRRRDEVVAALTDAEG